MAEEIAKKAETPKGAAPVAASAPPAAKPVVAPETTKPVTPPVAAAPKVATTPATPAPAKSEAVPAPLKAALPTKATAKAKAPAPKAKPVAKAAKPAPAPIVPPVKALVAQEPAAQKPVAQEPVIKTEEPAAPAKPTAPEPVVAKPVAAAPALKAPAPAAKPEAKPASTSASTPAKPKETTMSTPSFDFTETFKSAFSEFQNKAKAAYEKSTSAFGDYNEFAKGNVEAMVESGKILSSGLQELSSTLVADGREAFETLTSEAKELAAVKTPTDFFKLQGDLMRKHFDSAVAYGSKQSEAFLKLAGDVAAPISSRVSIAVDKVKKAA